MDVCCVVIPVQSRCFLFLLLSALTDRRCWDASDVFRLCRSSKVEHDGEEDSGEDGRVPSAPTSAPTATVGGEPDAAPANAAPAGAPAATLPAATTPAAALPAGDTAAAPTASAVPRGGAAPCCTPSRPTAWRLGGCPCSTPGQARGATVGDQQRERSSSATTDGGGATGGNDAAASTPTTPLPSALRELQERLGDLVGSREGCDWIYKTIKELKQLAEMEEEKPATCSRFASPKQDSAPPKKDEKSGKARHSAALLQSLRTLELKPQCARSLVG